MYSLFKSIENVRELKIEPHFILAKVFIKELKQIKILYNDFWDFLLTQPSNRTNLSVYFTRKKFLLWLTIVFVLVLVVLRHILEGFGYIFLVFIGLWVSLNPYKILVLTRIFFEIKGFLVNLTTILALLFPKIRIKYIVLITYLWKRIVFAPVFAKVKAHKRAEQGLGLSIRL